LYPPDDIGWFFLAFTLYTSIWLGYKLSMSKTAERARGQHMTPFETPFEFSEQKLAKLLAKGISQIGNTKDHILVSHTPPFQTKIDKLLNGTYVGSTAVRTFIEQQQPLLCLSGHIHESREQDYIGRTLVLNPGTISDGVYIEVLFEKGGISASLNSYTIEGCNKNYGK